MILPKTYSSYWLGASSKGEYYLQLNSLIPCSEELYKKPQEGIKLNSPPHIKVENSEAYLKKRDKKGSAQIDHQRTISTQRTLKLVGYVFLPFTLQVDLAARNIRK